MNPTDDPRRTPEAEKALTGQDRPARAPDEAEVVYFSGTPLLRANIGKIFMGLVIGLALIGLAVLGPRQDWEWWPREWWAAAILVAAGLAIIIIPFLIARTIHYRITNFRVDYERGLFTKSIDTLELWHVDDLKFRQNFLDRLMGVATITVISDDQTTPRLELEGTPRARKVFEALKQRVISIKRQRGVVIMDTGE